MRPQADRADLRLVLVADVGVQHILSEHAALQQEGVVGHERVESLVELADGRRHFVDVLLVEQIHLGRIAGVDLVLDAVQAGHQAGGEGQVGVGRRVGAAELDALGLRRLGVHRDAHGRRAVAGRVGDDDGGLVAGHQAAVGVGRRRADGQQGVDVLQDAADVPLGHLAQAGVAVLIVEQRLAVLPQALVGVHAGAVVGVDGLGHERDRLAVALGHVLDDVLIELHVVGHL